MLYTRRHPRGAGCTALDVGHLASENQPDCISKVQYVTLGVSLNKMLSSDVDEVEAKEAAEKDWANDKADGAERSAPQCDP